MRVLVTGASGFVGRHVVASLLARRHEVTAAVRHPAAAQGLEWSADVRWLPIDVQTPEPPPHHLLRGHDALVHLAWPGLPQYRSALHVDVNLPVQEAFLRRALDAGIGHLLVAGTCLEYGMQEGALPEDRKTSPAVAYGIAKDLLRQRLESLQSQRPFVLQWARLFYLHGPGQAANSLLAQLDRAIDSGASSFDMSGGQQLRDYLPVEVAAARLALLLDHPQWSGVINVCSGEPVSVLDLVRRRLAQRNARIELNLGHFPYPDYEPMRFWGESRYFQDPGETHALISR